MNWINEFNQIQTDFSNQKCYITSCPFHSGGAQGFECSCMTTCHKLKGESVEYNINPQYYKGLK